MRRPRGGPGAGTACGTLALKLMTYAEPGRNSAAMLVDVEVLPPPRRSVWAGCSQREFNVGCDCGLEPWALNQILSAELMGRLAAAETMHFPRWRSSARLGKGFCAKRSICSLWLEQHRTRW